MLTLVNRLFAIAFCTVVATAALAGAGMSASAGNFAPPQKFTNVNSFIAQSRTYHQYASVPLGGVNRFLSGNQPQAYQQYHSVPLGGVNRFLSGNQPQAYQQYHSVPLGGVNRFLSGNQPQAYQQYHSVPLGGVNRFLSGN
jgi:hypothetical protein